MSLTTRRFMAAVLVALFGALLSAASATADEPGQGGLPCSEPICRDLWPQNPIPEDTEIV
jgi:hypothetical protein